MINPQTYLDTLTDLGVAFFTGVPDSLLKDFCACVAEQLDETSHVIAANEGGAVGLGIGHHLGTGNVPVIYLQNSGLGNIINPILSLGSEQVYAIPMLIIVGWRGEPGVSDEPQHVHQGSVTAKSLTSMGLPYFVLSQDEDEAVEQSKNAFALAKEKNTPVFLLVKKNSFEKFKLSPTPSDLVLAREEAIIAAAGNVPDNAAIVCTTGMASRELFEYRAREKQGHHRDFLTVGGMGHASQIALGLSQAQPDRPVYCFDGDGAALMHMGSMAIIGQSLAANLVHIVFNNGVHDSVGGQATVGQDISFCDIALASGYRSSRIVHSHHGTVEAMAYAKENSGPHFIEIQVRPGNRSDIGRPTTSPSENKEHFMAFLADKPSG